MKDMLSFLIARDTTHQQHWLAVIEELGGNAALPISNSVPQSQEKQAFSDVVLGSDATGARPPAGRYTSGPNLEGKSQFKAAANRSLREEPVLGPARPDRGAQAEQMCTSAGRG